MASPYGHMFYIGLYWEKHEKMLSETTKLGALILGMEHQRSHVLHRLVLGKHEQLFLSENIRPRALLFCM